MRRRNRDAGETARTHDDEVAALLRAAVPAPPIPDHVSDQILTALGELPPLEPTGEPAGESAGEPAAGQPAKPRRRPRLPRLPKLSAPKLPRLPALPIPREAAAIVAVVGVLTLGIGISSLVDSDPGPEATTAESADADELDGSTFSMERSDASAQVIEGPVPLETTSFSFGDDVARILLRIAGLPVRESSLAPQDSGVTEYSAPHLTETPDAVVETDVDWPCPGPGGEPDAVTLVGSYDAQPVALLFHPPTGVNQLVEAWSCDGADYLDSVLITRPAG